MNRLMHSFTTTLRGRLKNSPLVHRIASNLGWIIVSEAIGKGSIFITNVYLARVLGVAQFGLFVYAQTISYYFWLAVDLGTNMYGIREVSKNKSNADGIISSLLFLRLTSGLIVLTVYCLGVAFWNMPVLNKLTFLGCGLYLFTYASFTDWALKGLEKFNYLTFGITLTALSFVLGSFFFVKAPGDVAKAAFIWSLSFSAGSIALLAVIRYRLGLTLQFSLDIHGWLGHMRESVYFVISGGLLSLYQYLPVFLLGSFYTSYEVGLFSAPYRVIVMLSGFGYLISMSFYPVLSNLFHENKGKFLAAHRKFRIIALSLSVPFVLVGTFFGDRLVLWLFGGQYAAGAGLMTVLVWLVPLYFIRPAYGITLLAAGLQKWHNVSSLVGVLVCLLCGVVLIPAQGPMGGAISLLASEACIMAVMAFSFRQIKKAIRHER